MSLLATDATCVENFFVFLPYFIIAPLQSAFVIYIMIDRVGYSFLSGLGLLIIFIPISTLLSKLYDYLK